MAPSSSGDFDGAQPAHDEALLAVDHHTAAGVGVVGLDGVDDLLEGEAVFGELGRVEQDLELGGFPAEGGDIRHPEDLLELRHHDPFLELLEARWPRIFDSSV